MDNRSLARAAAPAAGLSVGRLLPRWTGRFSPTRPQASETGKVILPGLNPTYERRVRPRLQPAVRQGSGALEVWGQYRNVKHVIEDYPTVNLPDFALRAMFTAT